ncbi:MAG: RIP metalloprotease RseP [Planctomycetota bacterium]
MTQLSLMDFTELGRYLQVALGIGLVIFVHEFGHFIAARLCGVRVEMFSLGFGPKLLGWKRGATTYQLALIPLGGFVKMAGEEGVPGGAPLPDELPAKSVGQRFFIYSGGVLMNVVFALLVFPPLLFFGVPFPEPMVGGTDPGGPAWRAGLEPGTRILAVDDEPVFSFDAFQSEVALSGNEELELRVRAPGASADSVVRVRPVYEKSIGLRSIGVDPGLDPTGLVVVSPDSAAFEAGLRTGDRITSVEGSSENLRKRMVRLQRRGQPLELGILRDDEALPFKVEPRLVGNKKKDLGFGIEPGFDFVRDLRPGDAVLRLGLHKEDRLLFVDGKPIVREGDFEEALKQALGRPFEIIALRDGAEQKLAIAAFDATLLEQCLRDVAIVGDVEGTRVAIQPMMAAAKAGLQDGDSIVRIGDRPVARWSELQAAIKALARAKESLAVSVQRRDLDGRLEYLELAVTPAELMRPDYGITSGVATYIYRAESFGEAVRIGTRSSWKFLVDSWNTLRGIFVGSVSKDSLGGIILISQVSYAFASMGIAKLLFFLCMLSLNLAFLNVLPIPVLDGGHLFFLLIEKIKGSPVNERVLGYSQMVGLVLILGLVVFVTFNDLRRFWE